MQRAPPGGRSAGGARGRFGERSGVYYRYGQGLAEALGEALPDSAVSAVVTSGSVDNIERLARGDADVAFALADTAAEAVSGTGPFPRPVPLRAVARLYTNSVHVVVPAGSPVQRVGDLAGRRVSIGGPGSGTELTAARMLDVAGVSGATAPLVENIRLFCAGDSDIGFTLADTAADAVEGKAGFDGEPQSVEALARIYSNFTQVLVRADAGISSIADLAGKSVSTGSPNSGTEVIALRLLEVNDLAPEDVKQARLGLPESVQGMKDGSIDALIWSGGLPTGGITDLVTSMGQDVTMLPLDAELSKMQDAYGDAYQEGTVPADTYGLGQDIATIAVPNLLVVSDAMPDEQAHDVTQTIFEHLDDLAAVHPEAKNISVDTATETGPVPLHPGAEQYFDEQG